MTEASEQAGAKRAETRWYLRPPTPPAIVERLVRKLGIPPVLASMVWSRGLREDALAHLEPDLALTAIPDLEKAAERLVDAVQNGRKIFIHGDYDADGITGTAVLTLGLRALGGSVTPFIPNRLTDGYGIHADRVEAHAEQADLFVTVDCGIGNLPEIERLQAAGVEVIVSDHHHPGSALPSCLIVHPAMSPLAQAGLPELTGAGVALHLLWAVHQQLGLEPPLEFCDLATIGTIADVAPLLGENRALIREGLPRLAASRWPGLRAALKQLGLRGEIQARDVAFVLAPRLNAAGRLGEADLALELLTTASERRARELAAYLDARNQDRRKIQEEMLAEALTKVDPEAPAIVVADEDWHPGVMGLVASHLLERYYKPVFIIAAGKGSVRSTPGISAVAALNAAAPHLERFGGHSAAAGFALPSESYHPFGEAIQRYVAEQPPPVRTLQADALLAPDDIGSDLLEAIHRLEPYGEGHRAPVFVVTERLEMARAVGREKTTLQFRVAGIKGVAWRQGALADSLRPSQALNVAVNLTENVWRNRRSIELIAEGLRPAQPLEFEVQAASGQRLRRGPPPMPAQQVRSPSEVPSGGDGPLWLTALPLADDPLEASSVVTELVERDQPLHFDLDAEALAELEGRVLDYPTLGDVRRAFVGLRREQPPAFSETKNALVRQVLTELDLLDALGRVRSGQKRDPYSSDVLVTGLLERYRLRTFANAYRHLDDEAFGQAVQVLFHRAGALPEGGQGAVRY